MSSWLSVLAADIDNALASSQPVIITVANEVQKEVAVAAVNRMGTGEDRTRITVEITSSES